MFHNVFCCFLLFVHIFSVIIILSTQPYTKSSCQLNTAHFQPVNSTLVFFGAAIPENEKIREPEEYFQLSEMPYFQAFFGIQFCTFDSNTTHSTCGVCGNMSTQHTFSAIYPFISSNRKSCTKLLGLQET